MRKVVVSLVEAVNGKEAYVITLADGKMVLTTRNQEEQLLAHCNEFASPKENVSKRMIWHNLTVWRSLRNFGIEKYAEIILINVNAVVSVEVIIDNNFNYYLRLMR